MNADGARPPRPKPADVTNFWRAAGPKKWYRKDADFDREIAARFLAAHEAAAAGHLCAWEATPDGALALLLLLDQFPRNMFRGSARAFATDPLARAVADRAIARGFDAVLGYLRASNKRLSRQRASPKSYSTRRCGTGFHFRMGAIRRHFRPRDRNEYLRGLSSA